MNIRTKTQMAIEHLAAGNVLEALKIAKDFTMGYTKQEHKILVRAYEMTWNAEFYEALGYSKELEMRKAKEILAAKLLR